MSGISEAGTRYTSRGIFDAILSDIHLCLQSSYAHSHGWRTSCGPWIVSPTLMELYDLLIRGFTGSSQKCPVVRVICWVHGQSFSRVHINAIRVLKSLSLLWWSGLWVAGCESAWLVLACGSLRWLWHLWFNVSCLCSIHWWQKSRAPPQSSTRWLPSQHFKPVLLKV